MTREETDLIGSMNMCDEISNEAYKKIMIHCQEQEVSEDDATLITIPDNAINEQVFIRVFGVDAWKQMIEFSNLNDQFREFWNAPYKAESEEGEDG